MDIKPTPNALTAGAALVCELYGKLHLKQILGPPVRLIPSSGKTSYARLWKRGHSWAVLDR